MLLRLVLHLLALMDHKNGLLEDKNGFTMQLSSSIAVMKCHVVILDVTLSRRIIDIEILGLH